MKVEFFPAAEQELLEAAAEYEAHLPGLGNDFILEVERLSSVLVEFPSLGEKLDSSTVAFHFVAFHTPLSSVATTTTFVLLRSLIEDADRPTGNHAYKTANKRV